MLRKRCISTAAFLAALALWRLALAGCGRCEDAIIVRGEELAVVPISENVEQVGSEHERKFRVYPGPKYYRDEQGVFRAIDMTAADSTSATYVKKTKSVRPLEFRKDGDKAGFMVIRADAGRLETLLISLESLTINGAVVPVVLTAPQDAATGMVNMGGVMVQTRSGGSKIMIPATDAVRSYKAVFLFQASPGVTETPLKDHLVFRFPDGSWFVGIDRPKICDMDGNQLVGAPLGEHTLTDLGGGRWRYTKSQADLDKLAMPKTFFLDVDMVYSEKSDGYCYLSSNSWLSVRNSINASAVGNTIERHNNIWYAKRVVATFFISRLLFFFDTAALSGTVESATINVHGYVNASANAMFQLSNATAPIAVGDYDAVANLNTGTWGNVSPWTTGWNQVAVNSQGITDIQNGLGGTIAVMMRDLDNDYKNVQPDVADDNNGAYFSDWDTEPEYDPYLEITFSTPAATGSVFITIY